MRRGVPEAPRWAWAVILVGVVVIVGLIPVALGRGDVAGDGHHTDPSEGIVTSTRSSVPAPTTTRQREPLQVLVIGDNFTSGSAEGGNGRDGWPRIVGATLAAEGRDVTVDVSASDGGGYTQLGAADATFIDMAKGAGPGYDLVIFFGGTNDTAAGSAVKEAAYEAEVQLWNVLPDAYILVIGPAWVDAAAPASVRLTSQSIRAAAQQAGVPFVDPIRQGWFAGEDDLIGADRLHPTDAGHRRIAERVLPAVRAQLDVVARALASTDEGK